MIRWIPYTFVRTVLFFIGGILLAHYRPGSIPYALSLIIAVVLAALYLFLVVSGRRARRVINPGWIALPLIFLLGYSHLIGKTESRDPGHMINSRQPISYYRVVVTRFAEERTRSWKTEAKVTAIHTTHWEDKGGKIILYFSKDDFAEPFRYGDVLLIKGHPRRPDAPSNPGEFDYREHLALKNIYHQHFIRKDDALKVDHDPVNPVIGFAFRTRERAEATLNRFVDGDRQQAIASALVLGVTDGLDNELLEAYSATGSMHILAVSGLHVSVIYFLLLWMFSPANKFRRGRWAAAIISLLILWIYALVTGLTPSVLRAVTMFSFLAVARPWARSTNIYNTLAVSAFCLLLADPFLLFSVGFQLSYLAVLGIVYIYPRVLRLWEPGHSLTVEIWKITAVSIAAQIATFPLGLLYFHQFPNYFLLSNLLVVPLSFVVLVLGLAVLAASIVAPIAAALGYCLELVIRFLNGVVFTLEAFPFSMTENVYITGWQCALLMAAIIFMLTLFEYRKFRHLVFASVAIMGFAVLQWVHFFQDVNIERMTVYKVPGHTAVDLLDHGRTFFVADAALRSDVNKIRYHITPNRLITGVRHEMQPANMHAFEEGILVVWMGSKILHVSGKGFQWPERLNVDYLVIGNNAVDVPDIAARVNCKKIILDSSNSFFFASRFLEAAKLHKLDVHSVLHEGAFVTNIEKQAT